MPKTLKIIFNINASSSANQFIYYFKRLPLIGKLLPDYFYQDIALKKVLTAVVSVFKFLMQFVYKALYVGLMVLAPVMLACEDLPKQTQWLAFVHVFFFLSFLIGAVQSPVTFESDKKKYICVKLMRVPAQRYILSMVGYRYLRMFVAFLPSMLLAALYLQAPVWQGLLLTVLFILWRISSEALHLKVFAHKNIVLSQKHLVIWPVILVGLAAAYVPVFLASPLPLASLLLNGFFPLVFAVSLAALCTSYILNYKDYRGVVNASVNLDQMILDPDKNMKESRFADVKLQDKDFSNSVTRSDKYKNKTGYDYLNAVFFERHRRMLWRPIVIRLIIITAVFLIGAVICFIFPKEMGEMAGNINRLLPIFVFVMYFASIGERVCRAMFYNCDISLLRYGYYRQKNVILKNFKVRIKKIAGLNFITALAMSAAALGLVFLSGYHWPLNEMVPFILSIWCLALFFSVHHLFLYYVFQPYTTELGMKNPFFNIINTAVYVLCYLCLKLDSPPKSFAFIVLCATIVYIIAALILVRKFSPKTFRVK